MFYKLACCWRNFVPPKVEKLTRLSEVTFLNISLSLQWRHDERDGVSNHQPHDCLLMQPFIKKTSKLRVTGLCAGNSPGLVNSPHKGPVTRKMFPFDDVIMIPYISNVHRNLTKSPSISIASQISNVINQRGLRYDAFLLYRLYAIISNVYVYNDHPFH